MPDCQTCNDERWVCERHMDKPWSKEGCQCDAGAPCPDCNPSDYDNPPALPNGFVVILRRPT